MFSCGIYSFSIEYKSTLYNYLLLLLIGLFLGYKITMKAEKYTLEEINKKKQERKMKQASKKESHIR